MSSPIQRIPRGLLAQLDARGTGRNPDQLSDEVRGTINLEAYYLADLLAGESAQAVAVTAIGTVAPLDVPAGEVWRVVAIGAQLDSFSGAFAAPIYGCVQIIPPGSPFGIEMQALPNTPSMPAAGEQHIAVALPQPLCAASGTRFQYRNSTALGAVTMRVTLKVLFQRLVA